VKRKKLSLHVNSSVREALGITVRPERGIYINEIAPPEEVWYTIVLANGKIGTIHLPVEVHDVVDDCARLWRLLDERDPLPRLVRRDS
jgi:hypothetical protein